MASPWQARTRAVRSASAAAVEFWRRSPPGRVGTAAAAAAAVGTCACEFALACGVVLSLDKKTAPREGVTALARGASASPLQKMLPRHVLDEVIFRDFAVLVEVQILFHENFDPFFDRAALDQHVGFHQTTRVGHVFHHHAALQAPPLGEVGLGEVRRGDAPSEG